MPGVPFIGMLLSGTGLPMPDIPLCPIIMYPGRSEQIRLSRPVGSRPTRFDHTFVHAEVKELVNLQNVSGKAKPYQVRQFLELVERYNLKLEDGK